MFEIRNYHFEPRLFEEYKTWAATLAVPYIRTKMHSGRATAWKQNTADRFPATPCSDRLM